MMPGYGLNHAAAEPALTLGVALVEKVFIQGGGLYQIILSGVQEQMRRFLPGLIKTSHGVKFTDRNAYGRSKSSIATSDGR